MKQINHQLTHSAVLVVAVAVLAAFVVFAGAVPSSAAPRKSGPAMGTKALSGQHVEARIAYLHTKLNITPAQEESWNNVAQVMMDNAKTMDELIKTRSKNAATMTPVDDLKSYSEIADAHADGLQKFIPVFASLYDTMSDAQKMNAAKLFRHHGPMKSKAKAKAKAETKAKAEAK
jgi:periplasmic protein CpxP/Spy